MYLPCVYKMPYSPADFQGPQADCAVLTQKYLFIAIQRAVLTEVYQMLDSIVLSN